MQPTLTEKQQFWLHHLHACEGAGQSMRAYADAAGLNIAEFYSWKATLRRKGALDESQSASTPLFRKANILDDQHLSRCRITLPSGIALDIDAGVEPAWVVRLVSALSGQ